LKFKSLLKNDDDLKTLDYKDIEITNTVIDEIFIED